MELVFPLVNAIHFCSVEMQFCIIQAFQRVLCSVYLDFFLSFASPFDCSFVNMELPRDHANACLHLHLGGGLLAASPSRNSLCLRGSSRGQRGAGQVCQTWGATRAVDRGRVWTWKLHKWSSKGFFTPDWQVLVISLLPRVLFSPSPDCWPTFVPSVF